MIMEQNMNDIKQGKSSKNVFVSWGLFLNMPNPHLGKLWIRIEGNIVKDHKIEAYSYGIILTNLQRILNVIKDTRYPKLSDDFFRVYIVEKKENSIAVGFQPTASIKDLDNRVAFNELGQELRDIISFLEEEDKKTVIEKLDEQFKNPIQILRLLESLRFILSRRDRFQLEIDFSFKMPTQYILVPYNKEGLVQDLIQEYTKKSQSGVYGVIRSINSIPPLNFVLITIDNEKITCHYTSEIENDIRANFKLPVFVKGIVKRTPKKIEMDQIIEFRPFYHYPLKKAGDLEFTTPLPLEVKYHKRTSRWNLSNTELSIDVKGKTFSEAIDEVTLSIEALIVAYLEFDDKKLSPESIRIKSSLQKYIIIERYRDLFEDMASEI